MIQTPLIPRYYQYEATEAPIQYFVDGNTGNPLVVLPTGAGKSICIAELTRRIMSWPNQRVMMLTHVKELIEQNVNKLYRQWPEAPAGIYSSGLKRRDVHDDIIFAGIQSVYKKSEQFGAFDIILIDECHLISPKANTMYQRFIEDQRGLNPFLKIVGYTATPFRTGSGDITKNKNAIFTDICYEKPMKELIDEGYLAPLVSKRTEAEIDLSDVRKHGGEYNQKQLQAATDIPEVTKAAVKEIVARGRNRRSWLLFCAGVEHANHVREELESWDIRSATVTGDTPAAEREQIIDDYKTGKLRAVTNCDVLTTGFDAPETDMIALLRGTASPGLYVQMCGRGTRPVYAEGMPLETIEERLAAIAHSQKKNCLVLDFAGNVMRHGPVDQVRPWEPTERGKGEAPSKACPDCDTITHASAKVCPHGS
jgi:DNA repair protein RadD